MLLVSFAKSKILTFKVSDHGQPSYYAEIALKSLRKKKKISIFFCENFMRTQGPEKQLLKPVNKLWQGTVDRELGND